MSRHAAGVRDFCHYRANDASETTKSGGRGRALAVVADQTPIFSSNCQWIGGGLTPVSITTPPVKAAYTELFSQLTLAAFKRRLKVKKKRKEKGFWNGKHGEAEESGWILLD